MQLIDADFNYIPGSEADSKALQGVAADVLAKAGQKAVDKQTVKLQAGRHPIKIAYIGQTASSALSLQWESSAAGIKKQNIPTKYFCRDINPVNLDQTETTSSPGGEKTARAIQMQHP